VAIIVRLLEEHELHLANTFFNKIYNTNRLQKAFDWEFIDCPNGKAIYVAAIDDSILTETKIVGIQCAIPLMMLTSKGNKILTAKSEDTLVDPNYRGQDIFNKMYYLLFEECAKVNIKFIWGYTPAYKPFVKLGFNLDIKVQQLFVIKPLQAFHFLTSLNSKNNFSSKIKILCLCFASKLLSTKLVFQRKYNFNFSISTDIIESFTTQNSYFNNDENEQLFLLQNQEYFDWRIKNNLYSNSYESIDFIDENKNKSAQIIINKKGNVGYIEQVLFDNQLLKKEKLEILNTSVKILCKKDISLIRFLAFDANPTNKLEVELLQHIGFIKINRGNWFVWKGLDEKINFSPNAVIQSRLYTKGNN